MNDCIFIHDFHGTLLDVNKTACEKLGYPKSEFLQMKLNEITPIGNGTPEYELLLDEIKKNGKAIFESVSQAKDGKTIPVEISARMITYNGTDCVLSISRDITERKRAEEQLRLSEERFSRAFHGNPAPMAIQSVRERVLIDVNDSFLRLFKVKREDVIGRSTFEADSMFRDQEAREERARQCIEHGHYRNQEIELFDREGSLITVLASAEAFTAGDTLYGIVTLIDMTEVRRKEQQLESEQKRFQKLLDSQQDGVVVIVDAKTAYANDSMARLLGYPKSEFLARSFTDFVVPDHHSKALTAYHQLMSGEDAPPPLVLELKQIGGSRLSVEITASLIEYEAKKAILCSIRDMTRRT